MFSKLYVKCSSVFFGGSLKIAFVPVASLDEKCFLNA